MITFPQFLEIVKNYVALYPDEVHTLKARFEALDLEYDAEDLVMIIDNMLTFPDKLNGDTYHAMKTSLIQLLNPPL